MKEKMKTEKTTAIPKETFHPVHNYKDRVFRLIFKEKDQFLELYNAMNGTSYTKPEDLSVTTLDNAIYMGMRNDVSFLLYDHLTLYEHQSTVNPNMPLRNLFYVTDIYSKLTQDLNLYGSKLIQLPAPQFVVFYNGTEEMPERSNLRLSKAYGEKAGEAKLELMVQVLNINFGKNRELMQSCRILEEYAIFVNRIREYRKSMPLEYAVEEAIQECIEEGILREFLKKNRAEVRKVSIYEYNEIKHIQQEREAAREDGWEEGREEGIEEGKEKGRAEGIVTGRSEGEQIGIIRLIQKMQKRGSTEADMAEFLGVDVDFVGEICTLMAAHPDAEAETLFELSKQ